MRFFFYDLRLIESVCGQKDVCRWLVELLIAHESCLKVLARMELQDVWVGTNHSEGFLQCSSAASVVASIGHRASCHSFGRCDSRV